jgi:hypothetical protein
MLNNTEKAGKEVKELIKKQEKTLCDPEIQVHAAEKRSRWI